MATAVRNQNCDDEGVPSVLIVDDEKLVRSGLALILGAASDITVVGAMAGDAALELVDTLDPDVVLLDIRMPGKDGLTILRELRAKSRPPIVAMLTTFDTDEYLAEALEGGAAGFLLKNSDPDSLAHFVRTLAAGGTVLAPGVNRTALLKPALQSTAKTKIAALTERETDVLRLLARGRSNLSIAEELHVSLGTVKDDVGSIMVTLGVPSRVLAALIADRAGLTSHS